LQLRGFDRVKDRIAATLKNAVPDLGGMLAGQADAQLEKLLDGRSLKGVAKDGPVFVVVPSFDALTETTPENSSIAVIVRVTDYAAFRDGVLKDDERKAVKKDPAGFEIATVGDKTICLVDRKGYAVMTPSKVAAAAYSKAPADK